MSLEDIDGYDVCRQIRSHTSQVALLGMTSFSLEKYHALVLENGAQCLIDKTQVKDICKAACMLANNLMPQTPYVSQETAAEAHARLVSSKEKRDHGRNLTKRENEVISLYCLGNTSKDISKSLGISEPTVKTYLQHIKGKLGVDNKTQAIIQWIKMNES